MEKQNQANPQQHSFQYTSNQSEEKEMLPSLSKDWRSSQKHDLNGWVYLLEGAEQRSQLLLPLLGYGLLVFALVDYIHIIIPVHFTDPNWELQTIGALVEQAAIPLLGLMFVFYRRQGYMRNSERILLMFLSWLALLVGLLYLLMLPLGITDTWRLYHANNAQIAAQSQQIQQFQQIKEDLNQAKTNKQIKQLLTSLTPPQLRSEEVKNPKTLKDQFLVQISQTQRSMQVQADSMQTNQRQALIKNSVKWNLGALISGTLLIWFWHLTNWARRGEYCNLD